MKHLFSTLILVATMLVFSACSKDNSTLLNQEDNQTTTSENALKSASLDNKYIVMLSPDSEILTATKSQKGDKMRNRILSILKKNGLSSSPEEIYVQAIQGFTARLTPGDLKKLAGDSNVKLVEADQTVAMATGKVKTSPKKQTSTTTTLTVSTEVVPWGVARVGGGIDATGKTAWIIDTGIELNHPDLRVDVARSRSFLSTTTSPNDDYGHGTHVAGIIAAIKGNGIGVVGVAAGATVVAVKVLDSTGHGTISGIIAGVDYVAANAKAGEVANMSLVEALSPALDAAVTGAAANGIFFTVAAGNSSSDVSAYSPAHLNVPNVFVVSAMDQYDTFASFSNFGSSTVDFCAPGIEVNSCWIGNNYVLDNGTSMAAPHVAGLLLLGSLHSDGTVKNDPDGNPDPIAHF